MLPTANELKLRLDKINKLDKQASQEMIQFAYVFALTAWVNLYHVVKGSVPPLVVSIPLLKYSCSIHFPIMLNQIQCKLN